MGTMGTHARIALVTGASRGLGRAIALALAREGCAVALAARDRAALDAVAEMARAAGAPAALVLAGDLAVPDAPAAMVGRVLDEWGGLDILVNNAGATRRAPFLELSDADFISGFALKFHATVRFCRAGWAALGRSGGVIVNIAGIGAHTPEPDFTVGGPVNSALINFSKAIAKQAGPEGIRVNTLCPGHIVTDRLAARIARLAADRSIAIDAAREEIRKEAGIDRYGTPEEIAETVVFLCSDKASYIHGATITVDGGATPGI